MMYVLFGVLLLVVGVLAMLKFLRNVQPDTGEIQEDLKELKQRVAQFKNGLTEWSDDISSSDLDQILEKGDTRTGSGVFLSITSQPVFAYAFRKYIAPGKNALIYILTAEHEFVFRITNKGTEVSIDGQKQGLIRANGVLYDMRNNEVAHVQRQGATDQNKLFIGQQEIGKIALPDAAAGIKALQLRTDLSSLQPKDAQIVQTFTVYELVTNIGELDK